MDALQWDDISLGDVVYVSEEITRYVAGIGNRAFLGMVTNMTNEMIELANIELTPEGQPDETYINIERPIVDQAPGFFELRPEFRVWCDPDALMGFGASQPQVPQGLTLGELVRYQEGMFVLAHNAPVTAKYTPPFFDYASASVIRQRVVVFVLNGCLTQLERRNLHGVAGYRHVVPEHVSFSVADNGPVLRTDPGRLAIGNFFGPGGGYRWHSLGSNERFAVETHVLERAGIDTTSL